MSARHHGTAIAPCASRTLDVGRALAISLVIYGHAMAPWFMNTHGWFSEAAFLQWKFGASFMMPFFFLISGLGWRAEKSLKATIRESLVLIATAWAASVALDVLRFFLTLADVAVLLGQEPVDAVKVVRHAIRMAVLGDFYTLSALWFLAALGIVRLLAAAATRIGAIGAGVLVLALIAAGLTAQMMSWRSVHQIYLLGAALAFFLAGHAAKPLYEILLKRADLAFAVLLTCGALALGTFGFNQGCTFDMSRSCGIPQLEGGFGVSMIYGAYGNLVWFTITALTGCAFALAGTILVTRYSGAIGERLAILGRSTINILIVNAIILELGNPSLERWVAPHIPADNPFFFVGLFVLSVAATLLGVWLLKTPLKALRSFARTAARIAVDTVFAPMLPTIWALKRNRVPAVHD